MQNDISLGLWRSIVYGDGHEDEMDGPEFLNLNVTQALLDRIATYRKVLATVDGAETLSGNDSVLALSFVMVGKPMNWQDFTSRFQPESVSMAVSRCDTSIEIGVCGSKTDSRFCVTDFNLAGLVRCMELADKTPMISAYMRTVPMTSGEIDMALQATALAKNAELCRLILQEAAMLSAPWDWEVYRKQLSTQPKTAAWISAIHCEVSLSDIRVPDPVVSAARPRL